MRQNVDIPTDPGGRLGQVHVQCSQQQVDEVDPQIDTQRDDLETLNTHLTAQHDREYELTALP